MHIIQLTAGLDPARFQQLVVTGTEGPGEASMLPQARARGVEPVILPALGREVDVRNDLVALRTLYRLFRRWRPDIVETHTAKAGTLGRLAAALAGVPVRVHVFHGHVLRGYFGPVKTRVFVEVERALARLSTRIVVLGDSQRRDLLRLLAYGIDRPEKVVSIPLGFELAPFLAVPEDTAGAALRSELGLAGEDPQRAPLVGIVARLVPIKAHDVFLAAAAGILDRVPGAHFAVVGDGDRRAALEAAARRPPLAGRVHFLGWRADTPRIYEGLDVVLLTSDNEGMPTSIIEAMAAARPVVATRVGGVPDLVADGETGLLVPPRAPEAVAGACTQILADPTLKRRLGVAARQAVYPQYDVATLLTRMADFYTYLAAGKPPPRSRVM